MEERELKNIWKSASTIEDITINTPQLIQDFKSKMENRERIVRRRDLREVITAVVIVALYTAIIIKIPFSISSVGAFLMILSAMYIVYRLYRHSKSRFTKDLFIPIKEQLIQQRVFMWGQARLLRNVHLMYIPFFISYLIFEWGDFTIPTTDDSLVTLLLLKKPAIKTWSTILMVASGIYIIVQNRRAAKINWDPLINDIDTIIENLEKEEN